MDNVTQLLLAGAIGVLVGMIYGEARVALLADKYEETIGKLRQQIKTSFNLGMKEDYWK